MRSKTFNALLVTLSIVLSSFSGEASGARRSLCAKALSGFVLAAAACVSGCSQIEHQRYEAVYRAQYSGDQPSDTETRHIARSRDFRRYLEEADDHVERIDRRLSEYRADDSRDEVFYAAGSMALEMSEVASTLIEARLLYDLETLAERTPGGNVDWARRSVVVKTWPLLHRLYDMPHDRGDSIFRIIIALSYGVGLVYLGPEALVAGSIDAFHPREHLGPWNSTTQSEFNESRDKLIVQIERVRAFIRLVSPRIPQGLHGTSDAGFNGDGTITLFQAAVETQIRDDGAVWSAQTREEEFDRSFIGSPEDIGVLLPPSPDLPVYQVTPAMIAGPDRGASSQLEELVTAAIRLEEAHPVEHRTAGLWQLIREARAESRLSAWHLFHSLKYLASSDGRKIFEFLGDSFFESGNQTYSGFCYSLALRAVPLQSPAISSSSLESKMALVRGMLPGRIEQRFVAVLAASGAFFPNTGSASHSGYFRRVVQGLVALPRSEILRRENNPISLTVIADRIFSRPMSLKERIALYGEMSVEINRASVSTDPMTNFYLRLELLKSYLGSIR